MCRKARKLERRDMAFVFQPHYNGVAVDAYAVIQRNRERKFFRKMQRHHRSKGKPVLVEIAKHPAVRRWKLHVDKAQGALARLRPTIGLNVHVNRVAEDSNLQRASSGKDVRSSAPAETGECGRWGHKCTGKSPCAMCREAP